MTIKNRVTCGSFPGLSARTVLPALTVVALLVLQPVAALAQTGKAAPAKTGQSAATTTTASPSAAMVITGDREAPLVLSIIPWAEPKHLDPPEVPMQPLLPKVIDYNRSLLDEPINRPAGAPPQAAGGK